MEPAGLLQQEFVISSGTLDAFQRFNRMRRLIEYRALAPALVARQSLGPLAIREALRRNDRRQASGLLKAHLALASDIEMKRLREGEVAGFTEPTR